MGKRVGVEVVRRMRPSFVHKEFYQSLADKNIDEIPILCPWCGAKQFVISDERRIWYCFGCGKGGNSLTYVKAQLQWSVRQCLAWLRATLPKEYNHAYYELKKSTPLVSDAVN
jgi:ribosomal protein L37AE/L43A